MKKSILVLMIVSFCQATTAQNSIEGIWYSADSTRKYKIYPIKNGHEAILLETKRANDRTGVLVLSNIAFVQKRICYRGAIHAVDDGLMTKVTIRKINNGKSLQLKLRRLFIFPVYIKWNRVG